MGLLCVMQKMPICASFVVVSNQNVLTTCSCLTRVAQFEKTKSVFELLGLAKFRAVWIRMTKL